jgi:hypothetical protein
MGEAVTYADSLWLTAPPSDSPGMARLVTTPRMVSTVLEENYGT